VCFENNNKKMASSSEDTMKPPSNNYASNITTELTEEQKLRAKYGGALPRAQTMLNKKLNPKGGPKYFDSGDYNVAKAQGKLNASKPDGVVILNNNSKSKIATPPVVPETVTGHEIPTPETLLPRKLSCAATTTTNK